jgi:hypothetical protein
VRPAPLRDASIRQERLQCLTPCSRGGLGRACREVLDRHGGDRRLGDEQSMVGRRSRRVADCRRVTVQIRTSPRSIRLAHSCAFVARWRRATADLSMSSCSRPRSGHHVGIVEVTGEVAESAELLDGHASGIADALPFQRPSEILAARQTNPFRLSVDRGENLIGHVSNQDVGHAPPPQTSDDVNGRSTSRTRPPPATARPLGGASRVRQGSRKRAGRDGGRPGRRCGAPP